MSCLFNVTLPWNPSDSEEGDYATTVIADNADEAVKRAAEEMADSGEKDFDSDADRQDYIESLIADGGYVISVSAELEYNLAELFKQELFPSGCVRAIDMAALAAVLSENRTRLVVGSVQEAPTPERGSTVRIGKLWWNADNLREAQQWKADYLARGAIAVDLKPEDDRQVVSVIITLDRNRATDILGQEVEEEEWLDLADFDNNQALAEGWDLFDVDGRYQLQRVDDPVGNDLDYDAPKFAADADALIFVATRASDGSTYHRDAIERIGTLVE